MSLTNQYNQLYEIAEILSVISISIYQIALWSLVFKITPTKSYYVKIIKLLYHYDRAAVIHLLR
jgi:hypothetical protein